MAAVIVMDISNTMTEALGDSTRLKEARKASNEFIDLFANRSEENKNIDRKLGFVAFNTSAHEIIKLGNCDNSNKKQIKEDIKKRINHYLFKNVFKSITYSSGAFNIIIITRTNAIF